MEPLTPPFLILLNFKNDCWEKNIAQKFYKNEDELLQKFHQIRQIPTEKERPWMEEKGIQLQK
jgi:hypothetical protein